MDSMTSGFNIATNLSTQKNFNEALGFKHQEVKHLIQLTLPNQNHSEILEDINKMYNGYLFSRHADKRIYNPDMVLYYLNEFQKNDIQPEELIDTNIASDYGKIPIPKYSNKQVNIHFSINKLKRKNKNSFCVLASNNLFY